MGMSTSQQIGYPTREPQMGQASNANRRLDEHVRRALNKIKKASTAEEIAELLNRDLDPGDRPFQPREGTAWLRNAGDTVVQLYWLESRPRRQPVLRKPKVFTAVPYFEALQPGNSISIMCIRPFVRASLI